MTKLKLTARKTTGGTSVPHPIDTKTPAPPGPQPPPPPSVNQTQYPAEPLPTPTPVPTKRKRANSEDNDFYCALCGDGGQLLVDCKTCGRANCAVCIPGLAGLERTVLEALEYKCPSCHGRRQVFYGLFTGNEPFFPNGMEIASSAIGAHGARIRTSPIAIVELILDKLPALGTPAQVLFSYLQASFASNPDDLEFLRCSFNIDPSNLGPHQERMSEIVTTLKNGPFERIILFVQTHADKERGDLFYCSDEVGNNAQSTDVYNFFENIVGEELYQYTLGRQYSALVLAACGSAVTIPSALTGLQKVTEKFRFSDAFAFVEPGLDPQRIIPFINEFAMNVLVTGHSTAVALPTILSSSSTGRFTGIVHLTPSARGIVAEQFEWLHHSLRPNGKSFPLQCPECHAYRPWVIPSVRPQKYNKKLDFVCVKKGCPGVCKLPRLQGYRQIAGDLSSGAWFSKKL